MAQAKPLSAQEHAAGFTAKKRTIALVVVALAFVMDLLDSTIVNVAIPAIRANLNASYAAIQWVVAGYSLAFSVLLVTGGRMGDVFGYKKLFMIGTSGFTVASLLSGVAQDPGMLIASRLLQGAMAALMVPQVMSLIQVMYKPEERSVINGMFGALGGLAATIGPVAGGLLIKANIANWDWRPIFLINIPVGLFALVAAKKYLPDGKSAHPLKLDLLGTVLIMSAILMLVYPLIQGRDLGWPAWTFWMMAGSLPLFVLFALWQRRKERLDGSPLVLPRLFRSVSFSIGMVLNLTFQLAMVAFFLTFTLLLQIGLGFSAIHAALTGLPLAVGVAMTMGALGEKVLPKMGRYALTFGSIIMGAGLVGTTAVAKHYGLGLHSWQLIPSLLVFGSGMGFVFGALFPAVLTSVDVRHAGSASGMLNAVQQIGGALGVALVGVVFFGQIGKAAPASFDVATPALRSSLAAQQVPAYAQQPIINGVRNCFVDRSREKDSATTPPSCQQPATRSTSNGIGASIVTAAKQANAINFNNAFRWSVGFALAMLALSFGLTFALPPKFKQEAYAQAA